MVGEPEARSGGGGGVKKPRNLPRPRRNPATHLLGRAPSSTYLIIMGIREHISLS